MKYRLFLFPFISQNTANHLKSTYLFRILIFYVTDSSTQSELALFTSCGSLKIAHKVYRHKSTEDLCADQIETSTSPPPPPPPGKPRAFELFKIGLFKFPPPWAKMVFKCPTLSSHFVCQMPLLKNNRRRFLLSVIKLVYIRGTQRHQFKRGSYFTRWLRATLYALRTRNTYY